LYGAVFELCYKNDFLCYNILPNNNLLIKISVFFTKAPPAGLLLESPFINISQAAKEYILAPLFLNNPWIRKRGEDNLDLVNLHFSNDK
jgi:hypothetical protein